MSKNISNIKINLPVISGKENHIIMNGHDITNVVNRISFSKEVSEMSIVNLGLLIHSVDIDLEGLIKINNVVIPEFMAKDIYKKLSQYFEKPNELTRTSQVSSDVIILEDM